MHDTGYFSALPSLEEYWQQVTALPTASVNAHFDRSTARPLSTRSVEVARNARLFVENLLASAEACGRASANVVYAAPRRLRLDFRFSGGTCANTFPARFYCHFCHYARCTRK